MWRTPAVAETTRTGAWELHSGLPGRIEALPVAKPTLLASMECQTLKHRCRLPPPHYHLQQPPSSAEVKKCRQLDLLLPSSAMYQSHESHAPPWQGPVRCEARFLGVDGVAEALNHQCGSRSPLRLRPVKHGAHFSGVGGVVQVLIHRRSPHPPLGAPLMLLHRMSEDGASLPQCLWAKRARSRHLWKPLLHPNLASCCLALWSWKLMCSGRQLQSWQCSAFLAPTPPPLA
mmetsp:Transcript_85048/g.146995  ORF Transcript_85048/g.146995 Transcript_85048/m.146995 type:complete len:231 (+) Transcript_85048:221-913(+)